VKNLCFNDYLELRRSSHILPFKRFLNVSLLIIELFQLSQTTNLKNDPKISKKCNASKCLKRYFFKRIRILIFDVIPARILAA